MTEDVAAATPVDNLGLLDLIIQTAPDAIVIIDQSGTIESFSPAAERLFGFREEEVLGHNVRCLMAEPHASRHDAYLERYLATGERRVIGIGREVRARRKNGDTFLAEIAVGELRVDNRRMFTGFIRDLTDRVRAARKTALLQRSLDQVARARSIGEMSTALAHEINQPLSAISNFARAAARALVGEQHDIDKAASHLDRIASEAQRAGEILRRMRRLVDTGRADLRPEAINDIVEEAIRLAWGPIEDSRHHIALDLSEDLPRVLADRVQIQQVIINLVGNAYDATVGDDDPELHISTGLAGAAGAVRLRAQRHGDAEVVITVSDSGPGLSDDVLKHMFAPMYSTKQDSLGVGLAVCRSIVHAHGGRIWAENASDGGATINFTLPAADPD